MDGLTLAMGESVLAGYLLALARVAGFAMVAPPFNLKGVPNRARATFILALAMPLSVWTTASAPTLASSELFLRIALQLIMGAITGFFIYLAVTALQLVGDFVDFVGGFSMTLAFDPLMQNQSSVMSRMHQLLAAVLLFATDLHLMVLHGLTRSMKAMPLVTVNFSSVAEGLVEAASEMFLGALQIAGPIIAVMLMADVALGLLTRAAPALNAFALAFPLKILLALVLMGMIVVQYPQALSTLVERGVNTVLELTGG